MNKLIFGGILSLVLVSCIEKNTTSGSTSISVKLDDLIAPNGVIVLLGLNHEGLYPLDTFASVSGTEFNLNLDTSLVGFYQINISRQSSVNLDLSASDSDILVEIKGQEKLVSGSENSLLLQEMDAAGRTFQSKTIQLRADLRSIEPNNDERINKLNEEFLGAKKSYIDSLKDLIRKADGSFAALYGLSSLVMDSEIDFFEEILKACTERLGDNVWLEQTKEAFSNVKKLAIGQKAPNFELKDPDGKWLELNDLRGSYVLIDFWASWCRPCRQENPNVVRTYNKFKDKNFIILGVTIDDNRNKWLEAIEKDGLPWLQVIDGLEKEVSILYNVNAVPMTYLLNPEGTIIDKNLRGFHLEQRLDEIL